MPPAGSELNIYVIWLVKNRRRGRPQLPAHFGRRPRDDSELHLDLRRRRSLSLPAPPRPSSPTARVVVDFDISSSSLSLAPICAPDARVRSGDSGHWRVELESKPIIEL